MLSQLKIAALIFSTLYVYAGSAHAGLRRPLEVPVITVEDLHSQYNYSISLLLNNLNHPDVIKGAVIASPSRHSPNYFHHWTRDAAAVHDALFQAFMSQSSGRYGEAIFQAFQNWVDFETRAQMNSSTTQAGYGEPKFNVDGTVFTGPWGRPQNDGPAFRAMTMAKWALVLIEAGQTNWVKDHLYKSEFPATKLLKKDLEYTAHNWMTSSFDLWEEVSGLHFYTLSIQRKALLLGALLAEKLEDKFAANYYRQQAAMIQNLLLRFFDGQRGYIVATLNQTDGWTHKASQLDIAVILSAIQGFADEALLYNNLSWFTRTMESLEKSFKNIYPINKQRFVTAIGRYPEDVYDGNGFGGGNPWFLATLGYGEFLCKMDKVNPSRFSKDTGIQYLARSLEHVDRDTREMSEQFSRINGYQMGARHLSWSYASYITAYLACAK